MSENEQASVWELLRQFAATQSGAFTSQEAVSWFRRHAPSQANDRTVRTHVRGASWNVGDRSQFASREPFLTRVDRGVFRRATPDEIQRWRTAGSTTAPTPASVRTQSPLVERSEQATESAAEEWHTEANVQAALVTALAADGWQIRSVANTATKEHGVDVTASRGDETVGIEVKGYPSRNYADPRRAGEIKRTQPSTQAGHWYSQAVLAAMRLRTKEPTWRSVIALPDFPRYRTLYSETSGSLAAAEIGIWWIDAAGVVAKEPA